jgi:type I restriction enzyme S subunit
MKYPAYPNYKPSGIEWLGEIPEKWGVVRLKYALWLQRGHDLPATEFHEGEYPVCGSNGCIGYHSQFTTKGPGVTVGRSGSVGEVNYVDKDYWAHNTALYVKEFRQVIPRYAFYLLKTLDVKYLSEGTAVGTLNRNYIHDLPTAIPNVAVQRAIAAFLDRETARIDALIEKKRRQIELLREKRSALISHAVTKGLDPNAPMKDSGIEWLGEIPEHWEIRKVKHLTTKIGSGKTPRGGAEVYVDSGVMLFRSQNIHFDGLRLDDVVFIEDEVDAEMANTRVRPGDVLLNITGASLGRCCLVGEEVGPANVNQHVCIVRARRSTIVPDYLSAAMSSFVAQSQIFASENGTSREGLNFQQVGNLLIVVPPRLGEQDEISRHIHVQTGRIDAIINKVLRSIDQLRELRTAMISAAVTGKIDVREGRYE